MEGALGARWGRVGGALGALQGCKRHVGTVTFGSTIKEGPFVSHAGRATMRDQGRDS